jgi:hypothetical protein
MHNGGASGGAIYCSRAGTILNPSTLAASNSVFDSNSANPITGMGGAVVNQYDGASIDFCTLTNNTAMANAGAIYNHVLGDVGGLELTNSTLDGNSTVNSLGSGGGIFSDRGNLSLTNCTISNNQAGMGGGINYGGTVPNNMLTIDSSTFNNNLAVNGTGGAAGGFGGGIDAGNGNITITNSTVSANTVRAGSELGGEGGGLYLGTALGSIMITNCTITLNSALAAGSVSGFGGGVDIRTGFQPILLNTIVAGNTVLSPPNGPDVFGTVSNQRHHNLIGNTSGSMGFDANQGDVLNVDPQLGILQNNGGFTQTHLPAATSPALDVGDNNVSLTVDQRGRPRFPAGDPNIDIGSVERQPTPPPGPDSFIATEEPSDDSRVVLVSGAPNNLMFGVQSGEAPDAPGRLPSPGHEFSSSLVIDTLAASASGAPDYQAAMPHYRVDSYFSLLVQNESPGFGFDGDLLVLPVGS